VPAKRERTGPRAPHPAALSEEERQQVLGVLDSDRLADKSPPQAWAVLLDEGRYYCSIRTMYRILESRNEVRERRAQAAHPPPLLRPPRHAGHLLPQGNAVGGSGNRDRQSREGIHRERHHRQRRRPARLPAC
jgi:hypothetical protein